MGGIAERARIWLRGITDPALSHSKPTQPNSHKALVAILFLALALRVSVAVAFPSVHHPDETFQYWEQGYRFAFGFGVVPWEYRTGIRSYLIPALIAGAMRGVFSLGGSLAAWQITVQTLLSLLSLTIVTTAFAWGKRAAGTKAAVLSGLVACTWFELVYFAAKPLTESISASLLFPAAYLLCLPYHSRRLLLLGGALLGLSFLVRFQLAPAVLAIGIICLLENGFRRSLPAALTTIGIIVAGGLFDWVTLGTPFQSVWLNFVVNAVHDKASSYGVEPFHWFGLSYLNVWAGVTILLCALILIGARRAPALLVVALIIMIAHSLIAHKEYRFVVPALPFLITSASIGLAVLLERFASVLSQSQQRLAWGTLAVVICGTSLTLAQLSSYRGNFNRGANAIAVFRMAAEVPELCGIGLLGLSWVHTPGYRGLGREVPIYPLEAEDAAEKLKASYNVLIRWDGDWKGIGSEYAKFGCSGNLCVAVRSGACSPEPDQTVNPFLIRKGE